MFKDYRIEIALAAGVATAALLYTGHDVAAILTGVCCVLNYISAKAGV